MDMKGNALVEAALLCLGETKPAWKSKVNELQVVIIAHDGRKLRVPRAEAEAVAAMKGKIERHAIRLLQRDGLLTGLAERTESELQAVAGIGKVTAKKIVGAMR